METYVDQAPCIYFTVSEGGFLVAVNKKLCTSLGYIEEELVGQKVDAIFTLPTRIFQQTHFFPLLKMQGYAEEIFITLRKKDGEPLPVLINAEKTRHAEENIYQYAGIIVYNRKKFEDELIAAKKAAEKALNENLLLVQAKQELQTHVEALDRQVLVVNQQNEELKQFSRVVTHDMQEPLRKLMLFSGMLLESQAPLSLEKNIERIQRATEKMKTVISGLQQYVWLSDAPLHLSGIALDLLFEETRTQLADQFPGVEVILSRPEGQVMNADYKQLQLLFYELLSNAVRFRKEGEKAIVSVSIQTMQRNIFRHVANKFKYVDFVRIQVQDQGVGFNPAYKDQTFQLFRTLHKEGGRGIGLALCKKVVDNHYGEITIDSKVGVGTTVTIYLPCAPLVLKELINSDEALHIASDQNLTT
jgi:sigma-B regulation protein RsbU (phosphoserine phosphatase)